MTCSIQAIDLHSHLNHGVPGDKKTSPIYRADADFLRQMYRSTNIVCGAFSTFASVLSHQGLVEENAFMGEFAQQNDWCFFWAVADPRQPETLLQAEALLDHPKCLGIKLHPSYHGYSLPEYADHLFGLANERRAVVLTHPTPEEEFDAVVSCVNRHPDMKLIIAHLGSLAHIRAIRQAEYQNIYTDTSGQAMKFNYILEYAVEQVGSQHIFFGTDTFSCAFQRGRVEYAMIRPEDKENILRNNALRVFEKLRLFDAAELGGEGS